MILKNHPDRRRIHRAGRWAIIPLAAFLLLAANFAVEQHNCTHADHATCALCALLFSPAAAIAAVSIPVVVFSVYTAPAAILLAVGTALPSPFDSRAPPAR